MHRHEIIVSNIGLVYDGRNATTAAAMYRGYVALSKTENGRGAGEDVTWIEDDEIRKEYLGTFGRQRREEREMEDEKQMM